MKAATIRHWLLLALIVASTIAVDQISKAYVAAHLEHGESWMPLDFLEPIFRFTHIHNTGAAFGIFPEGGLIFLVIAVAVSGFIIYYYRQIPTRAYLTRLALGLQMGGALGNVADRLRHGYVIDFMHLEHWPVFNVADSCIVIGVALLALEMFREDRQLAKQKQTLEKDTLS